ncbi:MAG: sterol desaturase family protein [Bdellovibrio sp.]
MFLSLPWFFQIFLLVIYYSFRAFVVTGLFFYIFGTSWGKGRKVSARPYKPEQIKFEVIQTLKIFILDSLLLVGVIKIGLFKVVNLGFVNNVISFLLLFVWVEVTFYMTHRLLHKRALLPVHVTHHKSKVPSPLSGFTFSVAERLILFFNTMSLIVLADFLGHPLSMVGLQTYFGVNIFLTVLGHTDLRIYPASWRNKPLLNYISDPPDHSLHHSHFSCNYGLFTNFLDKKFNTYRSPRGSESSPS